MSERAITETQRISVVDYRDFGQHVDLLPEYTEQLVKAQPDALYVGGAIIKHSKQRKTFRSWKLQVSRLEVAVWHIADLSRRPLSGR